MEHGFCVSLNLFCEIKLMDNRPIGGQPIFWDITAPARYDGSKSVTADVCPSSSYSSMNRQADDQIPLQLPGGTPYIVYMLDSSGYFGTSLTSSRPLTYSPPLTSSPPFQADQQAV